MHTKSDNPKQASFKWIHAVVNHSQTKGTDRAILLILAFHADGKGESFCGEKRIAKEAGIHNKTVSRRLPIIERTGELSIKRHGRAVKTAGGVQYVNIYTINSDLIGGSVALPPKVGAHTPKGGSAQSHKGGADSPKGGSVALPKSSLNQHIESPKNQQAEGSFCERIEH